LQRGLSQKELTEMVGAYGKVNHGGAVNNWEKGLNIPGDRFYARLQGIFPELGDKTDWVRPFNIASGETEYCDFWSFKTVRHTERLHPCEKPVELLRHIIKTSSYAGGTVLDCFMVSGSTGQAAVELGRNFIGAEKNSYYFQVTHQRILANQTDLNALHQIL